MPAGPGETLLTTVYADVHYYYRVAAPSQPQHDRFAKGSYVYLYYSATERRAKLEIANHAGTADQDAFFGYLDAVQYITYSSKHPTLCSMVLDQPRIKTQAEWHLPTWDERNEKRWAHKLHTVDLYFWTERDATAFMGRLNGIVPAEKLDIGDVARQAAPTEHKDSMSPVVQRLENTAIGAQFPPRAGSTTSAQSLPGPPTPASTASIPPPPQQPTPVAYNPAAPRHPNSYLIAKDTAATGRSYAQYSQQGGPSLQSTPQSSYFPGPPQAAAPPLQQRQASFGPQAGPPQGGPPPQQQQQRQPSFGPQAPATTQQPSFGPQAGSATQYASYPTNFGPGVTSPGPMSPGIYQHQPPTPSAPPSYASLPPPPSTSPPGQQSGQQAQVAGFSSYKYSSAPQAPAAPGHYNAAGAFTGSIHSQAYRPTEEEAAHGHHSKPQSKAQTEDKLGEKINKLEKGVSGFLKRLDKF
ncbi:hypothetical protein AMS68_002777 [Peltaster fructicola]|uniref:Uncharacterized protein n=1 Tax=Peltaster fructicola TaxID=286661 RepID=A0A6H0XS16_9PEZI|nr:hypothetical protein AMS68_002777 [Peltaster fructicola]